MVNKGSGRRRLSVEDRRRHLVGVGVDLIATRPWDVLTMTDIAAASHVSKPLLYHYFSTKRDLYVAAVRSAADQLRSATRADPTMHGQRELHRSLEAHVDWVDAHALAYRTVLQGGASGDPDVRAIVEGSRAVVVERITHSMALDRPSAALRIALRGWVGFLEAACLDWLRSRDLSKPELVRLLAATLQAAVVAADT